MNRIPASSAFALPSRGKTFNVLETVAIGTAGGLFFLLAHLPGGLITGAMVAVAIAAIAGRPLMLPAIVTQSVLVLLGISLGSLASRELLAHLGAYPLSIGLLALATFCSTFGSSLYLQRFHGWDRTSAFLAGSPGALSQIVILAAEKGADVPAIAVVQTMRVILLTAALPLMLALTGNAPSSPPSQATAVASPLDLVELIAAALAAAMLLRLIKFPASWLFGAMVASIVLYGAGLVEGGLPPIVRSVVDAGVGEQRLVLRLPGRGLVEGGLPPGVRGVALVGIGSLIGTRFARMKTRTLLGHIHAAIGSFTVAIVISAAFVAVIALTTEVHFADIIVAYAPGAMDAMLALALTMHIDPIFVSAHHLSRFLFVTLATPGIVHLFGRPQEDVDD